MRLNCSAILRFMVLVILSFVLAGIVLAQTTLDRLEQQIRQRVSPSQGGTSVYRTPPTPSAYPAQSSPPEPSPDNISIANNSMPVYLGIMADDRRDRGRGVRIADVRPGGPAEKAGLRKQDLVTSVEGIRVRQLSDLTEILGVYQPADVVEFDIIREGEPLKIKVTLGRPPTMPAAGQTAEVIPLPPPEPILPVPGPAKTTPSPGKAIPTPAKTIPPPANDYSSSDSETIEKLQNRIAELERQVAELKQALSEAQKKNK